MANDSVIDGYLDDLYKLLGSYRYRDRVVEEVADHLETRVQALMAVGFSSDEAAAAAVDAFGNPNSFVSNFEQVRAMPTNFTRWAGLVGLCAPLTLGAAATQPQDGSQVPWLMLIPFACLVVGLVGVIARTRGSFGRARGLIAGSLILIGGTVGLVGGYGLTGVLCSIAVLLGLTLLLQTAFRVGALPRPATLMVTIAGVGLAALIGSEIKEQSAPVYAAGVALAIGWLWLQYTLWSESRAPRRN